MESPGLNTSPPVLKLVDVWMGCISSSHASMACCNCGQFCVRRVLSVNDSDGLDLTFDLIDSITVDLIDQCESLAGCYTCFVPVIVVGLRMTSVLQVSCRCS